MVIDLDYSVKEALTQHLNLRANWFGDYGTSQFGVIIELCWDYYPITSCCVNFLEDDKNG